MTCGGHVAADQRYCLQCGQRQGEPRLPFMDATSMMDVAVQRRQPPAAAATPPRKRGQRISANTALIAGVGTLLLALGIGVLIGRSGNHSAATTAAAPQIIKVPSGSGETVAETPTSTGSGSGSAKKKSGGGGGEAKAAAKTGASGQSEAAESVLKPASGVKLPPTEVKPGDKGSGAGYNKNGEFDGSYFGE